MPGNMSPEEIDAARRQVARDLAIAEAEQRRAGILAEELATALRKADEALQRAQTLRAMLGDAGADAPDATRE